MCVIDKKSRSDAFIGESWFLHVSKQDYDEKEEVLTEKELLGGDGHADLDTSKEAMGGLQKHWGVNAQDEWQEDGQENEVEDAADAEEEEHPDLWFLCDGCKAPIPAGKRRFDCTVCENFTLCMKCFRVRRHPHKFVRRRVPESCTPPEDFKGMQIGTDGETNKSLDEYFQLDYEDIIGGDLPTRFKYRSVKPNDYGIPANVILSKSSKELNQMVSIKKLRPYRDEEEPESSQSKRSFGKGKGDSKGSWKGKSKGKSKGSSEKETSQDELSSSRFKAYNLEGDKFAGVKVKRDWSKSKKSKTKSSASKSWSFCPSRNLEDKTSPWSRRRCTWMSHEPELAVEWSSQSSICVKHTWWCQQCRGCGKKN